MSRVGAFGRREEDRDAYYRSMAIFFADDVPSG
jgi:hypothetical protein